MAAWAKKHLIGVCVRLRNHIRARELAAEEELTEAWPAECGCERDACSVCRNASKHEWYMCHSQLMRIMGRGEWHASRQEDADEEVLKGLRAEPKLVTSLDGSKEYVVHPKGLEALLFLRNRDWLCQWLQSWIDTLRTKIVERELRRSELASPIDTIDRLERELAYQMAVCAHVAIQPGPGVDREAASDPGDLVDLDPLEMQRLHQAFFEVNVARFSLVPYITGPSKPSNGKGRLSWSVFYSQMGKTLKEDPKKLMRDRSLAELLIQVRLAQPTLDDDG